MRLPQRRSHRRALITLLALLSLLLPNLLFAADSGPRISPLIATPAGISFSNVQIGGTASSLVTVKNAESSRTLNIYTALVEGAGFSLSGLDLPLALGPKGSYTFTVIFTPTTSATVAGSITMTSRLGKTGLIIPLSGTTAAGGQLGVLPASLVFGSVAVGSSATLSGTLTASNSSVTVSSGTSSSGEFQLSGISFPFTLASGQSQPFSVIFAPQSSGTASANVMFGNNGTTAALMSVTGSGTTTQHSVSLSWNPSTSVVIGYNVYRSAISGGPYSKISSAVNVNTTYSDPSVSAGQIYYYVTTSVDESGVESAYSNEVAAQIPSP